jgi:hypothetical protein
MRRPYNPQFPALWLWLVPVLPPEEALTLCAGGWS